jgi:hypothetical protein
MHIYLHKLKLVMNETPSDCAAVLCQTFVYLFAVFVTCFGLCSAIIRKIIHIQNWELYLALHLYHK